MYCIVFYLTQSHCFRAILRVSSSNGGGILRHTGQIKEIIWEWNLEIIYFWLKKCSNTIFLTPKPIKETLGIILKEWKKIIEGATVVKFVNKVQKLRYLH